VEHHNRNNEKSGAMQKPKRGSRCFRCGRAHNPHTCPASEWQCFRCQRTGHTSKMCKTRSVNCVRRESEQPESEGGEDNEIQQEEEDFFALKVIYDVDDVARVSVPGQSKLLGAAKKENGNPKCAIVENSSNEKQIETIKIIKSEPLTTELMIGNVKTVVEIDTGASVTVMCEILYKKSFAQFLLKPCQQNLQTINHERLVVVGQIFVPVITNNGRVTLNIVIIQSENPFTTLVGRNWLDILIEDWRKIFVFNKIKEIKQVSPLSDNYEQQIKQKFDSVFGKSLIPIKQYEVHVQIKSGAVPVFRKPYNVPFALRDKVKDALNDMVRDQIIFPINQSEWASPIVVIEKKNGDLRICTDFKGTVNKVIEVDTYPIPHLEDIFAVLTGGQWFSVLDLSGAYQQLKIAADSQKYFTINTPFGLFRYNRLTYGIASAPAIFQRVMEEILKGIPKVCVYLDDILATGSSLEEARETLGEVFKRLREYNVQNNANYCNGSKSSRNGFELSTTNAASTNWATQSNQPKRGAAVHQPRVSPGAKSFDQSRERKSKGAGAYLEATGGQHIPGRHGQQPETDDACPPTDCFGAGRPTTPQYDDRGRSGVAIRTGHRRGSFTNPK
jgi:Reverse transcriptase (RNA-dependent DNA polymerase)